jgi:ElaB/YqjD/DUF883 family membrane-anchored ribosome-binding protein
MTGTDNEHIEEKVEQVAEDAADNLRELVRESRQRADELKKQVVKQLNSAAETMRREAREAGAADDAQTAIDNLAGGMEKAAHYLNKHSYDDMTADASRVVRRNPLRALAVTFVVGLVAGMVLSRK